MAYNIVRVVHPVFCGHQSSKQHRTSRERAGEDEGVLIEDQARREPSSEEREKVLRTNSSRERRRGMGQSK